MSAYLVSARKYRPQTFDTVVGQEHITTTLKNAIRSGHLAHAYLFTGPRGVGKTTCARILARTINCENPTPDVEACGVCPTCVTFQNNASLNVFELDAASNNSVEDIRELVAQVRFAPQQGRYKIYIIDEVHMLSTAAFNAFLKTLEEPPPYAIFILATTEKHKILPTILSRCQIFDFRRITTDDTVAHLQGIAAKEGVEAEDAALHVIAQKSEGCMRDALSMLDRIASFATGTLSYADAMEHLALLDAEFYFTLTDHLLASDVGSALLQLDAVLAKGFEGDAVLGGLAEHLRNLLLCKDSRMARLLDVPQSHRLRYHGKAQQAPPSFIISGLALLNESELAFKSATNKRLHTELALIRLCYLLQAVGAQPITEQTAGASPQSATPQPPPAQPAQRQERPASVPEVLPPKPQAGQEAAAPANPVNQAATVAPAAARAPVTAVASAPQATQAPVEASNPAPAVKTASTAPAARRVSRNILDDEDDASCAPGMPGKELTQELVSEIFDAYREKLRANSQAVLSAQFGMMHADLVSNDEVRITCPNEMAEEYAKGQRDALLEFFCAQAGSTVRVTTETRLDPAAAQAAPVVLSKQELYNQLSRENPALAKLKEGLNLQLDY